MVKNKNNHPWSNFLHARRIVIDWLKFVELRNEEEIARILSMDATQVKLILVTPIENEEK